MTPVRATLLASLVSIACLAAADAQARPGNSSGGGYRGGGNGGSHGGQSWGNRGNHGGQSWGNRGNHGGQSWGHRGVSSGSWRGGYSHGHYNGGHYRGSYYRYGNYWPLGIGVALAAPWYWGSYYYPYSYGPRYGYGPAWGDGAPYEPYSEAPPQGYGYSTPPEPTTDLGPVSEPGAPLERPLYLNYCASSKAYYPKVRACAEGWQVKRPTYQ